MSCGRKRSPAQKIWRARLPARSFQFLQMRDGSGRWGIGSRCTGFGDACPVGATGWSPLPHGPENWKALLNIPESCRRHVPGRPAACGQSLRGSRIASGSAEGSYAQEASALSQRPFGNVVDKGGAARQSPLLPLERRRASVLWSPIPDSSFPGQKGWTALPNPIGPHPMV